MEKLFAALRDRHPEYEVVDVRFLIGHSTDEITSVEDFDDSFAAAVRYGRDVDMSKFASL